MHKTILHQTLQSYHNMNNIEYITQNFLYCFMQYHLVCLLYKNFSEMCWVSFEKKIAVLCFSIHEN